MLESALIPTKFPKSLSQSEQRLTIYRGGNNREKPNVPLNQGNPFHGPTNKQIKERNEFYLLQLTVNVLNNQIQSYKVFSACE